MPDPILNDSILTTSSKSAYIYQQIQPFFSKLVVAVIILLIGIIIGKLLGRLTQKLLNSIELNMLIRKAVGLRIRMEEFIGKLVSYFIFFITVIIALDILELTSIILYILSIMIIVIIILSFFIGIKDFIPNIIAGLYIHKKRYIREGDTLTLDGLKGKVIHVNLTETRIETSKGDLIYIPNSTLTKKEIIIKRKKESKQILKKSK